MWFPGDLPGYVTRWPIPEGYEARITATVLSGVSGATIRPVYHTDYETLLSGGFSYLCAGVGVDSEKQDASEWEPCEAGELYVAIVVEGVSAAEAADLVVGLAEVQIRPA